ncbi:MAG: iron-sulfur cluster repair di-iron protein [Weeksellaceae bacterium]|nr:iron-sulfur cluster repair di-iron protein [Weeksellaceae bacterium]
MNIKNDLIGAMVSEDFRTAAVFKKFGIDFCCKGNRTIEDACADKGIDQNKVYSELENLPKSGNENIDFTSWPLDLLADYVEKTHHRYVKEKSPVIFAFLEKLCNVHGGRHPELFEIKDLFSESIQDLGDHMVKEETILFPFIRTMVDAKNSNTDFERPHFGSVENPVNMMMHEHTAEGERFEKISALSNAYTVPDDGCNTYRVAFQMIQEFEDDLHKHIHLENNILFPKSVHLEKDFQTV